MMADYTILDDVDTGLHPKKTFFSYSRMVEEAKEDATTSNEMALSVRFDKKHFHQSLAENIIEDVKLLEEDVKDPVKTSSYWMGLASAHELVENISSFHELADENISGEELASDVFDMVMDEEEYFDGESNYLRRTGEKYFHEGFDSYDGLMEEFSFKV